MPGPIPEQVIEEVAHHFDIVDLIGEYVQLKRQGRSYLGLCPFHHEKTPSFTVDPDRQLFYCFGCQAGGNVFTFVQKKENLSFVEAVHFLADRAGITIAQG
ncbi:MAG: CHC2 zinc finger domain-containing protein, partial [Bacillota bacterium]